MKDLFSTIAKIFFSSSEYIKYNFFFIFFIFVTHNVRKGFVRKKSFVRKGFVDQSLVRKCFVDQRFVRKGLVDQSFVRKCFVDQSFV